MLATSLVRETIKTIYFLESNKEIYRLMFINDDYIVLEYEVTIIRIKCK
ncbi:MAG: hypothetical protein WA144_01650 [Candidatus Methanoperedens sp.]